MPKEKIHNVTVRMTAGERERLRVRAAVLGVSVSSLIHQALELGGYFKRVRRSDLAE